MEEHTSGYPSENSADVHVEKTRLGYIHVDQIYGRCAATEEYYARLMAVLTISRLKEKELFMRLFAKIIDEILYIETRCFGL